MGLVRGPGGGVGDDRHNHWIGRSCPQWVGGFQTNPSRFFKSSRGVNGPHESHEKVTFSGLS